MFDLNITKLLFLAVIALVIFGPNELPRLARQAGRALRELRQIAEGAKADLREGLGPEFQDFDFEDLNPKRFVAKHLFEEPADAVAGGNAGVAATVEGSALAGTAAVTPGGEAAVGQAATAEAGTVPAGVDDRPPFDLEAT